MSKSKKYTFFWKTESPFSQWHPSRFSDMGVEFSCAEQYMMYRKADLFGDKETALKVLNSRHPREMKAFGRVVKNFSSEQWDLVKYQIVKKGNALKFAQNPKLLEKLIETGDTILVEASPYDRIWGIGLSEDDPRALNESTWNGQNLLGKALTEIRNELS